jgi:hypothetical protein
MDIIRIIIRRALYSKQKSKLKDEKPTTIARLSYHKSYSNKISRLLAKFDSSYSMEEDHTYA